MIKMSLKLKNFISFVYKNVYLEKGVKMTHFFNYPQTIKLVSGLNSISTLKKWRLKIERLTGHQFEEGRVQTGKRSYSKVYLFTDDDIEKLRMIADLKGGIGLKKAILKAYAPSRASPLSGIFGFKIFGVSGFPHAHHIISHFSFDEIETIKRRGDEIISYRLGDGIYVIKQKK